MLRLFRVSIRSAIDIASALIAWSAVLFLVFIGIGLGVAVVRSVTSNASQVT